MSELARWQSRLAAVLAQPAPRDDALGGLLRPAPGPTTAEGIGVYRGNLHGCRVSALRDVYPVCRRVLGNACFDALAQAYVTRVPSRHFDLNLEGRGFPQHLDVTVRENANFTALPWLAHLPAGRSAAEHRRRVS